MFLINLQNFKMWQNILVTFLIFTLTKSVNIRENGCSENDVQCLREKEEMHWCSDQGCSTCNDHSCVISCKGFSCGMCPNGTCCDGIKCNVCYNNTCCTTVPCNYCIHTCRRACVNSTTCVSTCVPQCRNSKHDVFVIPSARHTQKASVYIKGLPYHGDLTSGIFPTANKTILVSINGLDRIAAVIKLWQTPTVEKNETKNCTVSNLNLCFKENVTKCKNECQLRCQIDCNKHCSTKCATPEPEEGFNYYNTLVPGCCHIVHPRICYNTYAQYLCYKRSHRECSNLCTSKFVHIAPFTGYLPFQYNRCFYIQAYPYMYCGQYIVQNCDSCYVCNGKYNPSQCVNSAYCTNECRKNVLPYQPQKSQKPNVIAPPQTPCSKTFQYQNPFGYFSGYSNSFGAPLNYG